MDAVERLRRLEAIAEERDALRRKLVAVALLADRLRADGIVPVVVGGTALAVYTGGGYETKDVDLALPIAPEVDAASSRRRPRAADRLGLARTKGRVRRRTIGAGDASPGGSRVKRLDDFLDEVRRSKAERWAKILAAAPPGRVPGRRPRDPEKERLLARLDRLRLDRGLTGIAFRRKP